MPRPTFDKWDMTVGEVEPVSDGQVDPTQPGQSAG
jgi:hypothetical protein